jgi:hypothetical protein
MYFHLPTILPVHFQPFLLQVIRCSIAFVFDKWVIIQNNDNSEICARPRKVQDEAISIAYNIKEFGLVAQNAKKSYVREPSKNMKFMTFLLQVTHLSKNIMKREERRQNKNKC